MSSKILKPAGDNRADPVVRPSANSAEILSRSVSAHGRPSIEAEIERRISEAREAGHREGVAAARSQLEPLIERLARSIESIGTLRPRLRWEAEADLVRLSVAIARRILHRELTVDPEAIGGVVKTALEKLQAQEICRVHVHPEQEKPVRACLERLGAPRTIEVVPDRAREPGDVMFETARGNLDASVETQLQEIERGLADRLHRKL